jgi:hypothetical protein
MPSLAEGGELMGDVASSKDRLEEEDICKVAMV